MSPKHKTTDAFTLIQGYALNIYVQQKINFDAHMPCFHCDDGICNEYVYGYYLLSSFRFSAIIFIAASVLCSFVIQSQFYSDGDQKKTISDSNQN